MFVEQCLMSHLYLCVKEKSLMGKFLLKHYRIKTRFEPFQINHEKFEAMTKNKTFMQSIIFVYDFLIGKGTIHGLLQQLELQQNH